MLFDEGEATLTDRMLHPIRRAATASVLFAHAASRHAMRERDALLGGFSLPDPPEALRKAATWAGIALTVGAIVHHVSKASRKRKARR